MIEKRISEKQRPTLRTYGYMVAMIILGIAIGLLLYPLLRYPAIWQWGALGLSVMLLVL